jgi:hypothetical protein
MDFLGYVALVEYHFNLFGDSVCASVRQVHDLHQMHHRLKNHFGQTQWYS